MASLSSNITSGRLTRTQRLLCSSNDPCSFAGYKCSLSRMEGYEYCYRHILQDKYAPFQQCSFIYKNSKRCFRPTPISDKSENYCSEHNLDKRKGRRRLSPKKSTKISPLSCLNQLSSHVLPTNIEPTNKDDSVTYKDALSVISNEISLDDDPSLDVRLLVRTEDDSEFDSADSDADHLDHAGVFTTEEASRIYLGKLQKLKKLYGQEFNRLLWIFKEGRRSYLNDIKSERESMSNIYSQPKCSYEERELYQELKFLTRFHRSLGKEALLYKQSTEKRQLATDGPGSSKSSVAVSKCSYNEGSWRCGVKCVPLSRFCFKHILQDEKQVLFQACGVSQPGGEKCTVPVFPHPLKDPICVYHTSCSGISIPTFPEEELIEEGNSENSSCTLMKPKVIDFSDNGSLVISESPPENILSDSLVVNSKLEEKSESDSIPCT